MDGLPPLIHPRVAIVTGAAQGIGAATALRLADDGFDVAVAGRIHKREQLHAVAKAIEAKGRRSVALFGDVAVEADIIAMVERTVQELGAVDVMVANAGIFGAIPFMEVTADDWDRFQTVNARSVMLCFKYAAAHMIKQGRGGSLIGMASIAAKKGLTNASAYCASKFAMRGMAQSAALELRKHNITVNTIAPGIIDTPMATDPEDDVNGGRCSTLIKNLGLPADTPVADPFTIAGLVSYMVKPEAYFLTGQCVSANGGVVLD